MKFAVPSLPASQERKLIGFYVEDVHYAIDIMSIREIINPVDAVPIPTAPEHVIGVADHREAVVPIVDLRRRFGAKPVEPTRKTKWILVKLHRRDVGLVVDRVSEVLRLGPRQRRETHPLMKEGTEVWIADVYSDGQGLVFELDVEKVAGSAEDYADEAAGSAQSI